MAGKHDSPMTAEGLDKRTDTEDARPLAGEKWNYNVLLGQGTCADAASTLASPRLVIPFLYFAIGAPVFFAGLLLPVVQFARLVTQLVAAPVITTAKTRKWHLMLSSVTAASALSIIGLATQAQSMFLVVVIFLLVALVLGVVRGLTTLAYNDLLGTVLSKPRRGALLFTQTMIAGVVTILVTWIVHNHLDATTPMSRHLYLLWGGVGITVLAACLIAIIREPLKDGAGKFSGEPRPPHEMGLGAYLKTIRDGVDEVAQKPWFRRFVITRCLLVTVGLAMPFYAVHAASLHAHKHASLSIFIVATSIAVIAGGPLWRWMGRTSERYVMTLGTAFTASAGAWALIIHLTPSLQDPVLHSLVFALVALGSEGVYGAATVYLVNATPDDKRPYYVAVSNAMAGVVGVVLAFLFGAMAHLHGVVWPVVLIVGLNVLAGFACLRLAEEVEP